MKCYQAKAGEIDRKWWLIDAREQVLGRLAAQVARILMGKTKPTYTPNLDCGDCVVVFNVSEIVVTGRKAERRIYTRYSGYPGGLSEETLGSLKARKPEELIRLAVRRMLPKTRLGRQMIKKLKIHRVLPEHGYKAQAAQPLALAATLSAAR